jgi:hypothetical protein
LEYAYLKGTISREVFDEIKRELEDKIISPIEFETKVNGVFDLLLTKKEITKLNELAKGYNIQFKKVHSWPKEGLHAYRLK